MKNQHYDGREADLELSGRLQDWVLTEPLPPRFEEHVWDRIAIAESRAQAAERRGLLGWLLPSLVKPSVAYTYAAALLALGILSGNWAAQKHSTRLESELGHRYVQSIDPTLHIAKAP